jgi:hypothetical protein
MSVAIDGTNGITYPNSSVQANAGVAVGQTWSSNLANSTRFLNTNYTNSTGKPITVFVSVASAGGAYDPQPIVGGVNIGRFGAVSNNGQYASATFIVPNGLVYQLAASSAALAYWSELS